MNFKKEKVKFLQINQGYSTIVTAINLNFVPVLNNIHSFLKWIALFRDIELLEIEKV
jgi:hypothetical protein